LLIPVTAYFTVSALPDMTRYWSLISPIVLPFEIGSVGGLLALIAPAGSLVEKIGLWMLAGTIAAILMAAAGCWTIDALGRPSRSHA